MEVTSIDARMLQKMFLAAAQNLENNKEWINELNVFPVPDGDTGTNMSLTIMSAAKEVRGLEDPTMETLAKAISSGSLRGARGNSGVILSQLFRGFTKEIKKVDIITADVAVAAFARAVETAYKAVMKPKEGTILTVAKGAAEKISEAAAETGDLIDIFGQVIEYADYVLSQTPEMLPVLKQAGVVDSGGQGLMQVLKGAYDCLCGKEIVVEIKESAGSAAKVEVEDNFDIKFGYCTEFIINAKKEFTMDDEHAFKSYLETIGDCIVVVADDDLVKVHVHTNDPGLAIQKALTYGSLSRMKIDNMREEHQEKLIKDAEKAAAKQKEEEEAKKAAEKKAAEPRKPYGFLSVSVGDGMSEIFKGLGVDHLIEGGQTMNPSTEDMLNAIDEVNADTIYILPNNKNIILAAQQAKSLVEDKTIIVIPTKTIPQGISAMIAFDPNASAQDNVDVLTDAIQHVKSGEVTYAVRDTMIDDKVIRQGNIMGISDAGIAAVGEDVKDTTVELIRTLVDEDSEIVSLYYGADIAENVAEELASALSEEFPNVDVEINAGGQPIYYYVVSVE